MVKNKRVHFYSVTIIAALIYSCNTPNLENLSKLTFEDEIAWRLEKRFSLSDADFLGRNGEMASVMQIDSISNGVVGLDHYYDEDSIIRLSKIRDRHFLDNLIASIINNYHPDLKKQNNYDIICDSLAREVDLIYDIKPGEIVDSVRLTEYNYIDLRRDRLIAILNQCSTEQIARLDNRKKANLWLEYQHGGAEIMSTYYYPLLHELFQQEIFSPSKRALSIDRLLVKGNFEQIYGSQIVNGELWPIADTTDLDSIRISMGMEKMADYLEYFGL